MEMATFSDKTSLLIKLPTIVEADDSEVSYIGKLNNHDVLVVAENGASLLFTLSSTAEIFGLTIQDTDIEFELGDDS